MAASLLALAVECTQVIRALGRGLRRGRGGVDLVNLAESRTGAAGRFGPGRSVGLQVLAKRTVAVARPRQDRDEPAAPAVDVAHCGTRAQLGVRDVEEVGASEQIDQAVPGRHVCWIIDGVAVYEPVGQRDRPVS